eukprot:TRINITY_DN6602_c0_g1_i13.p4 TRINITY_DN6602_c0_g1~~TRINITY_DN6602_c0_g1_i13.p4  ORF type:complete len:139 (-),score=52.73 TRINITY_DN6602_c0_g1_i13:1542-1937(-)
MIRRPPRSTHCISSAASDVYKRQDVRIGVCGMHIILKEMVKQLTDNCSQCRSRHQRRRNSSRKKLNVDLLAIIERALEEKRLKEEQERKQKEEEEKKRLEEERIRKELEEKLAAEEAQRLQEEKVDSRLSR